MSSGETPVPEALTAEMQAVLLETDRLFRESGLAAKYDAVQQADEDAEARILFKIGMLAPEAETEEEEGVRELLNVMAEDSRVARRAEFAFAVRAVPKQDGSEIDYRLVKVHPDTGVILRRSQVGVGRMIAADNHWELGKLFTNLTEPDLALIVERAQRQAEVGLQMRAPGRRNQ